MVEEDDFDETQNAYDIETEIVTDEEEPVGRVRYTLTMEESWWLLPMVGKEAVYYQCQYCLKQLKGPGSGNFLEHIRKIHPNT